MTPKSTSTSSTERAVPPEGAMGDDAIYRCRVCGL
jgi:hypothetical protein